LANEIWKYDAIVIGSGQGGNPLAYQLATQGEKVALIEPGPLGGTCVNTGCTPTKTMVGSAQIAHYVRNAERWGVRGGGTVSMDMSVVLRRKFDVVEASRTGWEESFKDTVDIYRDWARFTGNKTVTAGAHLLEGKRIFINTGAKAAVPDLEGLTGVPYLTNASIIELTEVPEHLLVLGGGYVGLEFGQMFRRFGSEVTIIHSGSQVLPNEDEDIAEELRKALEAEGIKFILNAHASRVAKSGERIRLTMDDSQTAAGSHLLIATGRTPQTQELDLDKTGVHLDKRGYIAVNDRLETSAPDIWAIGDVKGGPAFTHISYNDYQIIYGNLYEGKNLSTATRVLSYGVYTDPTLGRVGMTEKEARAQGRKLKIGKIPMTRVARAKERGETAGLMKIIVDAETDFVLGAAILSVEGEELVQILSTLMLAERPYTLLKGAIYIHPTLAEGFFALMDSVKPV
jgi:pyruvate/2-oxoglutarate dehydrogenase complex dihydrolipoamide dehydrogenase (E3) component